MPEFKYRKLGEALIDVILLIFFLKIGFTIRPAERPAEVMLITAAATYLIILGRSDRFGRAGLLAAVVLAMLYIFYWERPADAFPWLLWGGGAIWLAPPLPIFITHPTRRAIWLAPPLPIFITHPTRRAIAQHALHPRTANRYRWDWADVALPSAGTSRGR